jgi:hypothetical protein
MCGKAVLFREIIFDFRGCAASSRCPKRPRHSRIMLAATFGKAELFRKSSGKAAGNAVQKIQISTEPNIQHQSVSFAVSHEKGFDNPYPAAILRFEGGNCGP